MGHLIRINDTRAPSGTLEVRPHGDASATEQAYSDFDLSTETTTVLDAQGDKSFYVSDLADVRIKTVDGVSLDVNTEGVRAETIEAESQSFTGEVTGGAQAAGGKVYLGEVLDRWTESANAPDWKVRLQGDSEDSTLVEAFDAVSTVSTLYFNVKTYGALGDGVSDDYAAFLAAYTAAVDAGGGTIYIPASAASYVLSNTLSITAPGVSILGEGATKSVILYTGAVGTYAISVNCGLTSTTVTNTFAKFGITSTSIAVGAMNIAGTPGTVLESMSAGSMLGVAGAAMFNITTRTYIKNCSFIQANGANTANVVKFSTANAAFSSVRSCVFTSLYTVALAIINVGCTGVCIAATALNQQAGAAANQGCMILNSGTTYSVDSRYEMPAAGTQYGIYVLTSAGAGLQERGSNTNRTVQVNATAVNLVAFDSYLAPPSAWLMREEKGGPGLATGGFNPSTQCSYFKSTMTGAITMNGMGFFGDGMVDGAQFSMFFFNNTAGALNVTWTGGAGNYEVSASPTAVGAGLTGRVKFVWDSDGPGVNRRWRALYPVNVS